MNVILADHQHVVREGIKAVLESEKTLSVIAQVKSLNELMAVIAAHPHVDVLLIDPDMPGCRQPGLPNL